MIISHKSIVNRMEFHLLKRLLCRLIIKCNKFVDNVIEFKFKTYYRNHHGQPLYNLNTLLYFPILYDI